MATIINNPPASNDSNGPIGLIISLVILFIIVYLGFVYGLPAIRSVRVGTPQINVPSQIDVNVKQTN